MEDRPLIHWGIPGMKWGVRKARGIRVVPRSTSRKVKRNRFDQMKNEAKKRRINEKRFVEELFKHEAKRFAKIDASNSSAVKKFFEKYIKKDETLDAFLIDYHNKYET